MDPITAFFAGPLVFVAYLIGGIPAASDPGAGTFLASAIGTAMYAFGALAIAGLVAGR